MDGSENGNGGAGNKSNKRMMMVLHVFSTFYATVFLIGMFFGKLLFSSSHYYRSMTSINQQYYNRLDQQMYKEEQSFRIPDGSSSSSAAINHLNTKDKMNKIRNMYNSYSNEDGTNGNERGILSTKESSFFRSFQQEIDSFDDHK